MTNIELVRKILKHQLRKVLLGYELSPELKAEAEAYNEVYKVFAESISTYAATTLTKWFKYKGLFPKEVEPLSAKAFALPFLPVVPVLNPNGHNYTIGNINIRTLNSWSVFYRPNGATGNNMPSQTDAWRYPSEAEIDAMGTPTSPYILSDRLLLEMSDWLKDYSGIPERFEFDL